MEFFHRLFELAKLKRRNEALPPLRWAAGNVSKNDALYFYLKCKQRGRNAQL